LHLFKSQRHIVHDTVDVWHPVHLTATSLFELARLDALISLLGIGPSLAHLVPFAGSANVFQELVPFSDLPVYRILSRSKMAPQMKGLMQFISDVRSSKNAAEENTQIHSELINIQNHFKDKNLSSYQKQKYACKLIYICLNSQKKDNVVNLDFGLPHCCSMIESESLSERNIGYLALQLIYASQLENLSEFNLFSHLERNLDSHQEDKVALALHFLAGVYYDELFTTNELAKIIELLLQLIRASNSSVLVKKKSSLALLKILRDSSESVKVHERFIPRILSLLDTDNIGLMISLCSLVQQISKHRPKACIPAIPVLIQKLDQLIEQKDIESDYLYNGFPSPWLIVKIMRLLETLVSDNFEQVDQLQIEHLNRLVKDSIALVIKLFDKNDKNANPQFKNSILAVLFQSISLGSCLDSSLQSISVAFDALGGLLRSSEVNTRYLVLDSMIKIIRNNPASNIYIEKETSKYIDQFFQFLYDRDTSVRKKSTEAIFLSTNSSNIVMIVKKLFEYLPRCDYTLRPDLILKISILLEKYSTDATWYVQQNLKLVFLSGNYLKDEVWERVVQITINNEDIQLTTARLVLDYLKQKEFPETMLKIAAVVFGDYHRYLIQVQSPLAHEKELLSLLYHKYFYCSVQTRAMLLTCFMKLFIAYEDLRPRILDIIEKETCSIDSEIQQRSVEYLQLSKPHNHALLAILLQENPPFTLKSKLYSIPNIEKPPVPPPSRKRMLTSNWEEGYYRLINYNQGIFFENSLIKILFKCEKDRHILSCQLIFINQAPTDITGFTVSIDNEATKNFSVQNLSLPDSVIPLGKRSVHKFQVTVKKPFVTSPLIHISFMCGTLTSLTFKLPTCLLKCLHPQTLSSLDEYSFRWNQIAGLQYGEYATDVKVKHRLSRESLLRILERIGVSLIDSFDPNIVLGAGILNTEASNYGVLLRLELGPSDALAFKLIIRCTGDNISHILVTTLADLFSHGV